MLTKARISPALSMITVAGAILFAVSPAPSWAASSTCTPTQIFVGATDVDHFGMKVAAVGDINGDGHDEMFVGAIGHPFDSTGRGYVYSGADQSLLFAIDGEASGDLFGMAAGGGDLDGDGYSDLIVGAPEHDGDSIDGGRAYVFYGSDSLYPPIRLAADADLIIDGELNWGMYGYDIAVLDDLDGDSLPDVAIGETHWNRGREGIPNSTGRVFIHSGQTFDTLYTLVGENQLDMFGWDICRTGDVNKDSVSDFAVSAPHSWRDSALLALGHVYVYSGTAGELLFYLEGEEVGDIFGMAIDGVGDLNLDGYDDWVVSAHHYSAPGFHTGRAYAYLGGPGPFPDTLLTGDAVYQYTGLDIGDNFGGAAVGLGDINSDGYDDFAVAAYHWHQFTYPDTGTIYVYSGKDGSEWARLTDNLYLGNLSYSMCRVWDLDSDGISDLSAGAPRRTGSTQAFGPGQTSIFLLGDTDGDTLLAGCDNCPVAFNPDQLNEDSDTLGNACDNCPMVTNGDQGITIVMTGDVNEDITRTAADVIVMVNYVFKSGAEPQPCVAAMDVNCDVLPNAADIIYTVNHVFKSGPVPCDVCQAAAPGWACP